MFDAKLKIEWRGNAVSRHANDAAHAGLIAAGNDLLHRIQQNLDVPGPPGSAPGQFPHRRSGELQASGKIVINRSRKTVTVVFTADHAEIMEAKRPYIRRTYRESKSALRQTVLTTAQREFGHFRIKE
jgi:hypothetical protein